VHCRCMELLTAHTVMLYMMRDQSTRDLHKSQSIETPLSRVDASVSHLCQLRSFHGAPEPEITNSHISEDIALQNVRLILDRCLNPRATGRTKAIREQHRKDLRDESRRERVTAHPHSTS
jgi:hypothetical protein